MITGSLVLKIHLSESLKALLAEGQYFSACPQATAQSNLPHHRAQEGGGRALPCLSPLPHAACVASLQQAGVLHTWEDAVAGLAFSQVSKLSQCAEWMPAA